MEEKLSQIEELLQDKIEQHSLLWLMAENAKRWFYICVISNIIWGFILCFLIYTPETVTKYEVQTNGTGNASIAQTGGEITNGESFNNPLKETFQGSQTQGTQEEK